MKLMEREPGVRYIDDAARYAGRGAFPRFQG